jgi:hypothetical protein
MSELSPDFQSIPEEYQQLIRLAQNANAITVAPLQLLVGGWSGAVVYLVSVSYNKTGRVEHCILKLDRKGKTAKSDEITRHNTVRVERECCIRASRSPADGTAKMVELSP